jgi:hypothetical protein
LGFESLNLSMISSAVLMVLMVLLFQLGSALGSKIAGQILSGKKASF